MAKDILSMVYRDLAYSSGKYSKLHTAIKEDFKFVQGKQWKDEDVETLRKQGVKALSINKLKPIIKLITGIERQSKSDFIAFPEGEEDSLTGNAVTRLMKNVSKQSNVQLHFSNQFKNGSIGGISYLEPYIDYSFDLINGEMKFKTVSGTDVFPDPDGQEYDLSDHKFVIKVSKDLSKEDLQMLFPEEEKKIERIVEGKISLDSLQDIEEHLQKLDYRPLSEGDTDSHEVKSNTYDLIDYYYKDLTDKYFVVSKQQGFVKEAPSKEEAESVASELPDGQVIRKKVPVIKLYQVVGSEVFFDDVSWSYPLYKFYPIFPYFAELLTENIGSKELSIQGVVRSIKDLQEEFNKRRTQELRHLNSSANSGFVIEDGQLSPDEEENLRSFGSSPGVVIKRKKNSANLERISPMPLSQGHAQLASENSEDLKEASGVNPDLLASSSQSQSGRAILLKQRQGLVMMQEMLDNFATTKKLVGKFILSHLQEVYTVESAMKVLGDSFIKEAFTVPVTAIIQRGLDKMAEGRDEEVTELEQASMLQYPENSADTPVVDENNQLVPAVDFDEAIQFVNNILSDPEISKYDIAVGEGPFSETVRLSNFLALTDLAQQGVPIPPTTLIEMSLIPDNEKKKIIAQIEAQQLAAQQAAIQEQAAEAQGGQ